MLFLDGMTFLSFLILCVKWNANFAVSLRAKVHPAWKLNSEMFWDGRSIMEPIRILLEVANARSNQSELLFKTT